MKSKTEILYRGRMCYTYSSMVFTTFDLFQMDILPSELYTEIFSRCTGYTRYTLSKVNHFFLDVAKRSVKSINNRNDFKRACLESDLLGIIYSGREWYWDMGLGHCCRAGDSDMIRYMIYRGASAWNYALEEACEAGHLDIVYMMIEKGADSWNKSLNKACKGGHLEIVKLMLSKDAKVWGDALSNACEGGNLEVIELIVSESRTSGSEGKKGDSRRPRHVNWNAGLMGACKGRHPQIMRKMIENGARGWGYGLMGACLGGSLDVVNTMIEMGANDWDEALSFACRGGNIQIVKLLLAKGTTRWNAGLYAACEAGHVDITKMMIDCGATDWNTGFYMACRRGHLEIVKLIIDSYCLRDKLDLYTLFDGKLVISREDPRNDIVCIYDYDMIEFIDTLKPSVSKGR